MVLSNEALDSQFSVAGQRQRPLLGTGVALVNLRPYTPLLVVPRSGISPPRGSLGGQTKV